MRRKIFEIIEIDNGNNKLSHIYDIFMIFVIVVSLVPLAIKETMGVFVYVEWLTTSLFVIDYILRWMTADYKIKKGAKSFIIYPFTAMAIIDVLSILPTILAVNTALRTLRVFRLVRALRVLKIFKGFKYSKNIEIIVTVLKKQKRSLTTVGGLAVGYILLSALIIFNVEPETFATFFDAVYWATVSLTTVGYGDIYTISVIGKIITMVSAVLGVAIVALPAGIITAGFMNEIQMEESENSYDNKEI